MLRHGDSASALAAGAGSGMAVLWRTCCEAENECKRLQAELRTQKDAHVAERARLLARIHAATEVGQPAEQMPLSSDMGVNTSVAFAISDVGVNTSHIAAPMSCDRWMNTSIDEAAPRYSDIGMNTSVRSLQAAPRYSDVGMNTSVRSLQAVERASLLAPPWSEILEAARLAVTDGNELRQQCISQRLCAESAEKAAQSLEDRLAVIIQLCTKHDGSQSQYGCCHSTSSPDALNPTVRAGCCLEGDPSEAPPQVPRQYSAFAPGVFLQSRPAALSPFGVNRPPTEEREGSARSPVRWADVHDLSSPQRTLGDSRQRSCSASSPSSAQLSSCVISSPLAPSPLTPLAESVLPSPLGCDVDDRSPGSFRAHSLSYSGDAGQYQVSEAPQVAIVGPWSDDVQLARQMQRHGAFRSSQHSARPALGRGAPRGCRQPRRMKIEVANIHRLPEWVSRRVQKACPRSIGTRVCY